MAFKTVTLLPKDLARLDDGQGWWKAGDEVILGGYLPDDETPDPAFVLNVNGDEHDNWTRWSGMPRWLKQKFAAGRKRLDVRPHSVTLTDEEWRRLLEIGNGNASAAVRMLLRK